MMRPKPQQLSDAGSTAAGAEDDGEGEAAIALATEGKRELGPAILADVARFISMGLTETTSGTASYPDAIHAFITTIRVYAVPQYEGATRNDVDATLSLLRGILDEPPADPWAALEHAMREVALQ